MSETQAPRVWIAGNPEPSDVRLRVRDKHGDIWTPEQVLGGVRAWSTPETALATWDYLAKKWGPLTEVIASSLGVSGEDRSEPTPAPREPRRWPLHSPEPQEDGLVVRSTHTGVRFRYRASWGSWVALPPEGDDREHTWYAMNHPLGRGAAELVEELSEVVTPEGTS